MDKTKMHIEKLIFASRWLQLPLYLGLIVVQALYVFHFLIELTHLFENFTHLDETSIMLVALGLIDVVLISNLLTMVIMGGYETFISKLDLDGHPDQPEWLDHVNANVLKVKLAMAIISISAIHLLKTFINAAQYDSKTLIAQVAIHCAFLLSAVVMAYIDSISHSTKAHS